MNKKDQVPKSYKEIKNPPKLDIEAIENYMKNPGRRRIYTSVKDMQADIIAYFKKCEELKRPLTIQGLCVALDFTTRKSLLDYEGYTDEKQRPFLNTIKKAKNIIEQTKAEGGLLGRYNTAFTIFDLVNNHEHENKIKEERTSEHNINQPINFIISGEASELPQSENDINEI